MYVKPRQKLVNICIKNTEILPQNANLNSIIIHINVISTKFSIQ